MIKARQECLWNFALIVDGMSREKKLDDKIVGIPSAESSSSCIAWYGIEASWKTSNSKHVWAKNPSSLA